MTLHDHSGSKTRTQPQVILHIGHEKCGSKSIQQFLRRNRAELMAEGTLAPEVSKVVDYDMGLDAYGGNQASLDEYVRNRGLNQAEASSFDAYFENALLSEIDQACPDRVVFSFEGLLSRPEEQMHKIGGFMQKVSSDVRIFAVLRRQDSWAVSAYSTRLVHSGSTSQDLLIDDDGRRLGLRYYEHLRFWEAAAGAGGGVQAIALEDHPDVVAPFKKMIGTSIAHADIPRLNSSLSAYGQEVIRRLNETMKDDPLWKKHIFEIRTELFELLPHGAPRLPTKMEIDAFMQAFAEDNLRLKWSFLSSESNYFKRRYDYPSQYTPSPVAATDVDEWVQRALGLLP